MFFSKNTKITWKIPISTKDTAMRPKSCDFWLFCAKVFSFLIVFCYLYRTRNQLLMQKAYDSHIFVKKYVLGEGVSCTIEDPKRTKVTKKNKYRPKTCFEHFLAASYIGENSLLSHLDPTSCIIGEI